MKKQLFLAKKLLTVLMASITTLTITAQSDLSLKYIRVSGYASIEVMPREIVYSVSIVDESEYLPFVSPPEESPQMVLSGILANLQLEKYVPEDYAVNPIQSTTETFYLIRVPDLDKLGALSTALRGYDFFIGRIHEVSLGETSHIEQALKRAAVEDAKNSAEAMLETLGSEIIDVQNVVELEFHRPPPQNWGSYFPQHNDLEEFVATFQAEVLVVFSIQ